MRYVKCDGAEPDHGSSMATLCFLCPNTGAQVQARFTDNASEDEDHGEVYERVTCTACGRLHMVNPRTGEVLGAPHAHGAK